VCNQGIHDVKRYVCSKIVTTVEQINIAFISHSSLPPTPVAREDINANVTKLLSIIRETVFNVSPS
jgi:hypothetical protein